MLTVVLSEDDSFARSVAHRLRLSGYTVVRYRDPVKLADNLPELCCEALIVRQADFPLHWQVLAAALAHAGTKLKPAFILASPEPAAVAHSASALGAVVIPDAFSPASCAAERSEADAALAASLRQGKSKPQVHRKTDPGGLVYKIGPLRNR